MEITNKSIGLNIQKWRDNAGLTQEELAELANQIALIADIIKAVKRNPL